MGEKIAADFQLAEEKRDNLQKAYEQAHAHASSVLVLTLQWKDLEEHLDATRMSLKKGLAEMASREKGVQEARRQVEERECRVGLQEKLLEDRVSAKEELLGSVQNRIEECSKELKLKIDQLGIKKEQLEFVDTCLHKSSREVELKQNQLSMVVKNISLKEEKLIEVQKQLASRCAKLSLKDEELVRVQNLQEGRSKEVASQTKELEEVAQELKSKKNALSDVLTLTEQKSTELRAIQKNIDLLEASIREYSEKLEVKRKHYEEIQKSIQECSRKSRSKNKEYELLKKSVEEECAELRSRQKEYEFYRKSLDKSCHGLKMKEKEYEFNKTSLDKLFVELRSTEKEYESGRKSLDKLLVELRSKEKEYESSRKSLDKLCAELISKEKEYQLNKASLDKLCVELKSKEKEYGLKRESLEEPRAESGSKENKLDSIVELLNSLSKEVEGKKQQLASIEGTIKKYCEDVELREKEYKEIQNSIVEQNEVLKSKENQLLSIQILIDNADKELRQKKDEHDSIQKSILECSDELSSVQRSLREQSDELESKVKESYSAQKTADESLKELALKETNFDSMTRLIEEGSIKLQIKEKKFEENVKELKLKEIQLESIQKSVEERIKEVELKEKRLSIVSIVNTSPLKNLQPRDLLLYNAIDSYTSRELFGSIDGKTLQLFINEHLSRHDLIRAAISSAFSGSSDPAMLVLDAVQGFYPHSGEGSLQFDSGVVKRSCILLLEQLMRFSPQIKPQVKEDARMVAHQWKTRMIVESNSLDVLAFLQLLATYGLDSMFNPDELRSLTNMAAQHSRQVSDLRQAFGFNEMTIERSIPCAKIKMEEVESVEVQDAIVPFSVVPETSASVSLLSFLEDHSAVHDSMANEISNALKTALDPALVVLDVIKRCGHQEWENRPRNLKKIRMNRCILVLQHLKRVSTPVASYVKEEAEKLAIKWKATLGDGIGHSLEVLFFLHFLAAYELISSFDGDEMLELLLTVAHDSKAPELGRALGFSYKMNDFIQSLIKRKQNLEAVAFIYEFELVDKFSPGNLVQEYIQNAWKSINSSRRGGKQNLAIEKEKATLRAAAKCISKYKIESKMISEFIEKRLMKLERQKEDERTKGTTPSTSAFGQAQHQSTDIAASSATNVELQQVGMENSCPASKDQSWNNPSTGIKLQKKVVKLKREWTGISPSGQQHRCCGDAPAPEVHSEQRSLDNNISATAFNDQSKHQTISNAAAATATGAKLQPKDQLEQQRSNVVASSSVQLQQNGIVMHQSVHKPATPAVEVKLDPVTMKRDFRSTFLSRSHAKRERNRKRHKAYTMPTPHASAVAPGAGLPVNSAWLPQEPSHYANEDVGNYGFPPALPHFRVEGGWPNRYHGMRFFSTY